VTVVNNLGTPSGYERGEVLVRGERSWPLPSTRFTRLHLGDKSLTRSAAASEATDTAPLASAGPAGELRTTLVASGGLPQEQQDTLVTNTMDDLRPREAAGLTYTTPPLVEDVELTGPVVAHLFAATTAPDFDWQVRLTDVHPDGRSSWISDGQLRASLREIDTARSRRDSRGDIIRPWYTFAAHQSVPAGKVVEYYVELGPTSNIFRPGDRIRLDIQPVADAYVDSARTGGAGVLQIARGGAHDSSVLLPLVPHRCQRSVAPRDGLDRPADCAGRIGF
jgi:putative CocE/NonD family hydrolase